MRLELKVKGPPRPEIALTQKCRSKTKTYTRAFKSEQYIKTPWLCDCEDSNKLFCFPYSGNKVPAAPQTKWNYNTRTVKAIHDNLEPLKECMQAIMDSHNSDPDSYNQAQSLLSYSNNENFLYWLNFHATLMPHCEMLFKFLQSRSLDSIKIMNEVSKFERAINELRNAVPPPSPKKKRRPDDVNHSVMRKECYEESVRGRASVRCGLPGVRAAVPWHIAHLSAASAGNELSLRYEFARHKQMCIF
ncbi:hypothetical protein EVAR_3418_1 [Eumeta japonica]|uniref:Uncharacterized protein n=1 Tax=Eumeta variegata TaxID=151549 RepID=A0A4C1ST02_EUMVA|nr:hypothetical protein EVAR_3418_1 [Eumeta japonica]